MVDGLGPYNWLAANSPIDLEAGQIRGGRYYRVIWDAGSAAWRTDAAAVSLASIRATPEQARGATDNSVALTPATGAELVETFVRGAAVISTRALAQLTPISSRVIALTTQGYASAGDNGQATFKRVWSEPSHPGKFRSADRFMPDSSLSLENGGWWEVTSPVLTPQMFNAPTNGAAAKAARESGASLSGIKGDSAAILAATACAVAQGGKTVELGSFSYYIDQHQIFNVAPRWSGVEGATRFVQGTVVTNGVPSAATICGVQPAASKYVLGQGNALASDALPGNPARQITLTPGKGANFQPNTWAVIKSNALAPGRHHASTRAEFIFIESRDGDVLTCAKSDRKSVV